MRVREEYCHPPCTLPVIDGMPIRYDGEVGSLTERAAQSHVDLRSGTGCCLKASLSGLLATLIVLAPASAQIVPSATVMNTEQALASLPDPETYQIFIVDEGLRPEAVREIRDLIQQTIGQDHFFGAAYAHLPEGTTQLAIRIRSGLHSQDAAERLALRDCEQEREAQGSPCRLLARIVPEAGWTADGFPTLSSEATYVFTQKGADLPEPRFVARSRETQAWAVWGGENRRQSALDECNEKAIAAKAEPDCEIVIDDTVQHGSSAQ